MVVVGSLAEGIGQLIGIGSGLTIPTPLDFDFVTDYVARLVGSTVPYVVEKIIAQGKELNKGRVFIPTGLWFQFILYRHVILRRVTGFQSKELIVHGGLTLGDIDQYVNLDVTIDGADE
jgi:ribose 5-phosphate isomerase